jgi:ADP-heptose:LPS heptosyltransferase
MSELQLPAAPKIAILRPLQFGDLMCAIPAVRALRCAYPEAEITLIGLSWSESFVRRFHLLFDHFLEFPGFPGFPEQPPQITAFPAFLTRAQTEHFDLAIQMQGSGDLSNSIIELLGAQHTAGYYLKGEFCPDNILYLPYPEGENEIWRHLRLMQHLGIELQGDQLEFPVFDADWQAFETLRREVGLESSPYIVIHPGARDPRRRWAPEKFAAVADALARSGFQIVITGTADEKMVVNELISHAAAQLINLVGKTDAGTLAALQVKARLLVSNDTGASHLSAALCVPSVILFSASDPNRWAPLDRELHHCILDAFQAGPDAVLREVDALLQEGQPDAI